MYHTYAYGVPIKLPTFFLSVAWSRRKFSDTNKVKQEVRKPVNVEIGSNLQRFITDDR